MELEAIEACESGGGGIEKMGLASTGDTFKRSRGVEEMLWTFYVDAGGGVGQQGRWRGGDRDEKGRQGEEKRIFLRTHA